MSDDAIYDEYSQVKIVSQGATFVCGDDDFVPMGRQVHPMRSSDSIMWTVKLRNGNVKQFKFPYQRNGGKR